VKNYFRKIFYIFVFANLFFNISLAQSVDSVCPYTFSKDLQFGSTDHDVYVLQKILNSDKRTTIATDGVGSPGNESSYFGTGTREALKRFQALFIEYIGVADGKFSTRTRTVVQSLCSNDSVNSRQINQHNY
jgi:peptidoglycan hydrolase-like protein with peptidoglycan-binding domain